MIKRFFEGLTHLLHIQLLLASGGQVPKTPLSGNQSLGCTIHLF